MRKSYQALLCASLAFGQGGKGVNAAREHEGQGEAERVAIVVGVSDYSSEPGLGREREPGGLCTGPVEENAIAPEDGRGKAAAFGRSLPGDVEV
jgi:hypothetical protein